MRGKVSVDETHVGHPPQEPVLVSGFTNALLSEALAQRSTGVSGER